MSGAVDELLHQSDTSLESRGLLEFGIEAVVVFVVVALIFLESCVVLHVTFLADYDRWNANVKLGLVELLSNETGSIGT